MDESLFLGNVPVNQPLKNKRSRKKKLSNGCIGLQRLAVIWLPDLVFLVVAKVAQILELKYSALCFFS